MAENSHPFPRLSLYNTEDHVFAPLDLGFTEWGPWGHGQANIRTPIDQVRGQPQTAMDLHMPKADYQSIHSLSSDRYRTGPEENCRLKKLWPIVPRRL